MKILRLPQVIDKTGLSRTTVYESIKRGDFPNPVQLTERSIGWREHEIDEWIEGRESVTIAGTIQ